MSVEIRGVHTYSKDCLASVVYAIVCELTVSILTRCRQLDALHQHHDADWCQTPLAAKQALRSHWSGNFSLYYIFLSLYVSPYVVIHTLWLCCEWQFGCLLLHCSVDVCVTEMHSLLIR